MKRKIGYILLNSLAVVAALIGVGLFSPLNPAEDGGRGSSLIQPLLLTEQFPAYHLAPQARLFEDPQGDLTFAQIYDRYKAGEGEKTESNSIFPGYSAAARWIVFTLENRSGGEERWILDLGTRMSGTVGAADRLAFFSDSSPDQPLLLDGRRAGHKVQVAGQEKNAIPLPLEPRQPRTFALYIQPAAGTALALAPQVVNASHHQKAAGGATFRDNALNAAAALFIGIPLFFLWRYAYAVPAFLAAYMAAQLLIYKGGDEIISLGNNTGVVHLDLLQAAAAIAALLLTRQVLFAGQSGAVPRLLALAAAAAAAVSAVTFGPEPAAGTAETLLLHFLPLALPAFVFLACLPGALKKRSAQGIIYALAWLTLTAGAALTEASLAGLLDPSPLNLNLYWLCFAPHLALLSFASLYSVITSDRQHRQEAASQQSVLRHGKKLVEGLKSREASHLQAIDEARKAADEANKSRTEFLAIVSHEIRTPMTGIMGMIRLLTDTPLDEKQKEYVETLEYSCNALLALINDVLDFSKVGVKKMDIETINFDFKRLIAGVVPLMSTRAAEKKIELKTDVDPKTPMHLKGDPTRIRQILLNLIGNSIKFTDKGSVTLIVKPTGRDDKGHHLIYFGVKDTGIGMSPEVLKSVFVPYAQGHASIARRYGGTGLGLSICQQLVAAMGGMIEASSQVGQGTTFYFTLAFEEGAAEEEEKAAIHIEAIPIKVLVVDDNTINQKVVAGLLEKDKHTIVTVGGARAALEEIAKTDFDAILMDMEMPDIDGPEATRMIRALPEKKKAAVPIIAMTSNTSPEDLDICFKAGMNASCNKPIILDQLRAVLLQVAKKEGPFSYLGAAVAPTAPPPEKKDKPAPKKAEPAKAEPAAAKPAAALFNPETLSSLKTSMNKVQLEDMMREFYDKTEELIAAAEKAVADGDLKALAGRGHDIKGMTANFGLMALSEVGAQIDRKAKTGALPEDLSQAVQKLRPVYEDTRKTIDAWIKS